MKAQVNRWKQDPVAFVSEVLVNPETGKPFELYAEEERFLREGFALTADGRLPYPELLFSAPKESGKTALAAMAGIYMAVAIGGSYAEVYSLANDFEQAQSRVFTAAGRIVEASPLLKHSAKITANRIEFPSTGSFIQACASDYSGFAGANPSLSICDKLWGFVRESSRRLFDEAVPSPARKVSGRLVVSYAGFEGESELLEGLYKRGLKGEEIAPDLYRGQGILMYWTHRPIAPWQDKHWLSEMRQALRPNQFLRMIENRWVTSESNFVEMAWRDACVDPDLRPVLADPNMPVWIGVDASVKRDSTAIAACTWDKESKRVRLIGHQVFQPSAAEPLDFKGTIEASLLLARERFDVREVRYDPYQMQAVAQRLTKAGLRMVEFPRSVPNLTEASTNLYELIRGRNLHVYPDEGIRLAVSRAVALETSRGWRIAKEKQSHKIDVIVALAQAALGAVRGGQKGEPSVVGLMRCQLARARVQEDGWTIEAAAKTFGLSIAELEAWLKAAEGSNPLAKRYEEDLARYAGEAGSSTCAACGKAIAQGTWTSTGTDGKSYHSRCRWLP